MHACASSANKKHQKNNKNLYLHDNAPKQKFLCDTWLHYLKKTNKHMHSMHKRMSHYIYSRAVASSSLSFSYSLFLSLSLPSASFSLSASLFLFPLLLSLSVSLLSFLSLSRSLFSLLCLSAPTYSHTLYFRGWLERNIKETQNERNGEKTKEKRFFSSKEKNKDGTFGRTAQLCVISKKSN